MTESAALCANARSFPLPDSQPGQHKSPITRARAECARSTVAEALKALEWAGVLTR